MNSQIWLIIKSLSILVAHMRLLFILLCNSFDNSKHELSHIATWHLMLYLLKFDGGWSQNFELEGRFYCWLCVMVSTFDSAT